jgi:isoamylase
LTDVSNAPAGWRYATHPGSRFPPGATVVATGVNFCIFGGFTRSPTSGVGAPGTFIGLAEKIPYLRELGVTHVELLPVMAFDEQDVPPAVAARGLRNYWGYSTHSFFSPHPGYCTNPLQAPQEFRALIDAFHDAGIGVLMDVVFNHTSEGGQAGPVINFKGVGNEVFYHLDPSDRRRYLDYTGCGNTVNDVRSRPEKRRGARGPLVSRPLVQVGGMVVPNRPGGITISGCGDVAAAIH